MSFAKKKKKINRFEKKPHSDNVNYKKTDNNLVVLNKYVMDTHIDNAKR